jgi:hypothetical protein
MLKIKLLSSSSTLDVFFLNLQTTNATRTVLQVLGTKFPQCSNFTAHMTLANQTNRDAAGHTPHVAVRCGGHAHLTV